jgi:hypothetical protein
MISITNVKTDVGPDGADLYELKVNREVIATFTHNPENGLGQCLMLAAAEAIKTGRAGADHGRKQR